MGDRAEGFWWVRLHEVSDWRPLWHHATMMYASPETARRRALVIAESREVFEWGPYLGKEPAGASAAQALPDRWMCEHKRREPHYYSAKDYCLDCCSYIEPESRSEGAP